MHEFSAGVTSDNSFYGNVVNPLNSKVTAGGSSSGSAAAVAAGLVVGSICTDTSGSTRIPAACCGVVGFKPTYNSNMMEGITPISSTLDHIGIIAGSVNDARTIATPIVNANGPQRKSLSGIRIGVDRSYFGNNIDSQIDEMMDAVINGFVESGAEATEVDLSFFDGTVPSARVIGTSEVSYFHQKLFKEYGEEFDNQLFISVEKGMEIPAIKYIEALHKQKFCKGKLTEKFQEVDVILTPTMPIVTPEIKRIQDWSMEESIGDCMVRYTQPFNITGNPALSISSRYVINGIPQSFQMVAKHNAENLLFDLGKMYENEFIL
jgi:aspartyl-tRNA(Asn)/glutamyl-tRNA(Gln) amidotransferase subunit A